MFISLAQILLLAGLFLGQVVFWLFRVKNSYNEGFEDGKKFAIWILWK